MSSNTNNDDSSSNDGNGLFTCLVCIIGILIIVLVGFVFWAVHDGAFKSKTCAAPEACPEVKQTVCPEVKQPVCPEVSCPPCAEKSCPPCAPCAEKTCPPCAEKSCPPCTQRVCPEITQPVCPEVKQMTCSEQLSLVPLTNGDFTGLPIPVNTWKVTVPNGTSNSSVNGWTYTTDAKSAFGISNGNTTWNAVAFPTGNTQCQFAQVIGTGTSSMQQSLTLQQGNYILQFYIIGRQPGYYNTANTMNISINNTQILTGYTTIMTAWQPVHVPFTMTATATTPLLFTFTNASNNDSSMCITGMKIYKNNL